MTFHIVTLFAGLIEAINHDGVIGRAIRNGVVHVTTYDPRDYAKDARRTVDDTPYGGGPGMVMMADPVGLAIEAARVNAPNAPVIYVSPSGEPLDRGHAVTWSQETDIILVCGRYDGIDQRVLDQHVSACVSVSNAVVSGGELPALMVVDAVTRRIQGALGNPRSVEEDAFETAVFPAAQYTRPSVWRGVPVPAVLENGNHKDIANYKRGAGLWRTMRHRPDIMEQTPMSFVDANLLIAFAQKHLTSRSQGEKS